MTGPPQPLSQTLRNPNPMTGPPQSLSQTLGNPNPLSQTPLLSSPPPSLPLSQIHSPPPSPSPDSPYVLPYTAFSPYVPLPHPGYHSLPPAPPSPYVPFPHHGYHSPPPAPPSPYVPLPHPGYHSPPPAPPSPYVPLSHPGYHSPPPAPPSPYVPLPHPGYHSPSPPGYHSPSPTGFHSPPPPPYVPRGFHHSPPPPSPSLYYSYNSPPQPSPSPFSPGIIPGVGPARHWRLSPPSPSPFSPGIIPGVGPARHSRLSPPRTASASLSAGLPSQAGVSHWFLSPRHASSSLFCPPGLAKAWSPSPPASASAQGCPSESLSSRSTVPLSHQPPPIKEVVAPLTKRQLETMRRQRFEESKCRRVYVHGLDPSLFGQPSLFASFYEIGEIEQVMALYSHPSEKLTVSILYNSTSDAEDCIIFEGRGHLATELCPECPLF